VPRIVFHKHGALNGAFPKLYSPGNSEDLGVTTVLHMKPPHSFKHFPHFGYGELVCTRMWRLQGYESAAGCRKREGICELTGGGRQQQSACLDYKEHIDRDAS
jgi:hypothetical protein